MSDVIFIGLPNAGKSSVLKELSQAKPKVAAYPFTTLNPKIGICDDLVLMDLPGLIEETFKGKGLGDSFVKHTKRTSLLAHFVSLESENVIQDYKLIRKELGNLDKDLFERPEILILTKKDEVDEKNVEKVRSEFKDFFKKKKKKILEIIPISILDDKSLENLKKELGKAIEQI